LRKILYSLFILGALGITAKAAVKLPSVIASNMVLQQKAKVALWGASSRTGKIRVQTSWDKKQYEVLIGRNGQWYLTVQTPGAGGPFSITFNDGDSLRLDNILIGEVWLCSGQSNMEMPMRGFNSQPILNSNEIIASSANPQLRLFKVSRATALQPAQDCKGSWEAASPNTVRDFSALAYQYGALLQKQLNVPVGIVLSTVGGTTIQTWMDEASLKPFREVVVPKNIDTAKAPHKLPTTLYNGMIAPLTRLNIRGFIWLQGESNRHQPELYLQLFPAMVSSWRKEWNLGELPFYYVQIAPFGSSIKTLNGPRLREAQLKAMSVIPNSGMVSALDVGMEKYIHFMDKTSLAKRLSYWALAKTYQVEGISYSGPVYQSMAVKGNEVTLSFDYAEYGLTSFGRELKLFTLAGADQVFHPAVAVIRNGKVVLSSKAVAKPVAARYAFAEWVVGDLYNNEGLPASSFRTDDWNNVDALK